MFICLELEPFSLTLADKYIHIFVDISYRFPNTVLQCFYVYLEAAVDNSTASAGDQALDNSASNGYRKSEGAFCMLHMFLQLKHVHMHNDA